MPQAAAPAAVAPSPKPVGRGLAGGDACAASPVVQPHRRARIRVDSSIAQLTHARLVRINRATQQLEPWLAEKYGCTPDGLTCTLTLRRGVRFSDGTPFTSADVLFSFQAVYDETTGSWIAETLTVGGKPLAVSAPDASTVVVKFPSPFGPGLRLLDALPILPKHKLEAALKAGSLRKEWGPTTRARGVGRARALRRAGVQGRRARRPRAQPALLAQGRRRAARCRISIGSRSRSCRTRTRNCCGCSRARRISRRARSGPTTTPR